MELSVNHIASGSSSQIQVSDACFGRPLNSGLVHQVVTAYLSYARAGTKAQKNRSDVRGGGIKPWKQKGTGRARAGTIRSPLWRTGGVTFAARPRSYAQKINKKMYRHALSSIVSELIRQKRMMVIDELKLNAPKTKLLKEVLNKLKVANALIVLENTDETINLAARNMHSVEITTAKDLNPASLVGASTVLITSSAIKKLEERVI